MDINLTGQIAAILANNLKPPWYNPLIIIAASALGGAVTGIITLFAVNLTNVNAKERDELNRKEEARKARREELKNAFKQFSIFMLKGNLFLKNSSYLNDDAYLQKYADEVAQSVAELWLIDSDIVEPLRRNLESYMQEMKDNKPEAIRRMFDDFQNEVVPLMQNELNKYG
ncbi:MAG: hypothetical protein ABR985_02625 [Methanotrichaceae archaeon]|jgi:hypothetical protein